MSWQRFFRRRRKDAKLLDEIDVYLAEEIAENIARGMPEEEARRKARVKLGNVEKVRETLWQQNTLSVEKLWRDVRYALRTLMRAPGFSLIAIAVMALCIGAATSLFTIVRSVLFRPLPFRDPDSLPLRAWSSASSPALRRYASSSRCSTKPARSIRQSILP